MSSQYWKEEKLLSVNNLHGATLWRRSWNYFPTPVLLMRPNQ